MSWQDEIANFLEDYASIKNLKPDTDIYKDLCVVGDDFHEMIEKYATQYQVDMTDYLWYFHADEEGQSFGGLFFDPPYKRVKRIPVTPALLAECIITKKWQIQYPEHKLPKRRYDLLINGIIMGVFASALLMYGILKVVNYFLDQSIPLAETTAQSLTVHPT